MPTNKKYGKKKSYKGGNKSHKNNKSNSNSRQSRGFSDMPDHNPANQVKPGQYNDDNIDKRDKKLIPVGDRSANNPKWYEISETITKQFANLPFSTMLGTDYRPVDPVNADANSSDDISAGPGIMTIEVLPSVGISNSTTSPVNIAAKKNFSYVREANSGSVNYEATDFMMYILAMTSIYSLWTYLVRSYGLTRLFNPLNRYTPQFVVDAIGTNYSTLTRNVNNYLGRLNMIGNRINQMYVPANMDYIIRQMTLFDSVYSDSGEAKAQLYAFKPVGFWKFVETDTVKLEFTKFETTDPMEQLDFLENLLEQVLQSSSIAIMSGDISKAYGASRCIKLPQIDVNFSVLPLYDAAILSQIENMVIQPLNLDEWDVTQQTETLIGSWIVFRPEVGEFDQSVNGIPLYGHIPLNIHADTPSPAEVIESIQLISTLDAVEDKYLNSVSVVVPYKYKIHGFSYNNLTKDRSDIVVERTATHYRINPDVASMKSILQWTQLINGFRIQPFQVYSQWYNSGAKDVPYYVQEVDNVVTLDMQQIKNIQDMCVQGVFHIK